MIDATTITGKALEDYDKMMIEVSIKVKDFAPLAMHVWADVLRELEKRGKVIFVSGSCEDIGSALITRNY